MFAGIPAVSGYAVRLAATARAYPGTEVGHATSLQTVAVTTAAVFCRAASGGGVVAGSGAPVRAALISVASCGNRSSEYSASSMAWRRAAPSRTAGRAVGH